MVFADLSLYDKDKGLYMNFLKNSSWLLVAALLAVGCGREEAPLASQGTAIRTDTQGQTFLAFAPAGRARAAKLAQSPADAGAAGRTVAAIFSPDENGDLSINEENGPSKKDDIGVKFSVRKGALEEPVLITMRLYGEDLGDMVVAFQPAGLEFLEMAELYLAVGDERVDLPLYDLHAWHIYDDGAIKEVSFRIIDENNGILFKIDVPGFSRYSMGGGT